MLVFEYLCILIAGMLGCTPKASTLQRGYTIAQDTTAQIPWSGSTLSKWRLSIVCCDCCVVIAIMTLLYHIVYNTKHLWYSLNCGGWLHNVDFALYAHWSHC